LPVTNSLLSYKINDLPITTRFAVAHCPPLLSPIHAMDIPSVRRPPVSVMLPADRVSAHDLPLAETLSAVEGELFHNITNSKRFQRLFVELCIVL